jgi:hypothetical protein
MFPAYHSSLQAVTQVLYGALPFLLLALQASAQEFAVVPWFA